MFALLNLIENLLHPLLTPFFWLDDGNGCALSHSIYVGMESYLILSMGKNICSQLDIGHYRKIWIAHKKAPYAGNSVYSLKKQKWNDLDLLRLIQSTAYT